jgi:class 3 adenylate cyclase
VARLEEALDLARRVGARPWEAQCRHDLARALASRAPARARDLVGEGLAAARELDLHGLVDRLLAVQRVVGGTSSPPRGATSIGALTMSIEAEPAPTGGEEAPVTLLFSDIEGSTRLNDALGDAAWLDVLEEHNAIVRRACAEHGGTEVKSAGDGFMLAFSRPEDGLACAVALQRALAERDAAGVETPVRVRIGVHTGPAIRRGRDFFGRNVVIAARIADQATGGEILVSEALLDGAGGPDGHGARRELELKGLAGTYPVRAVDWAA